MKKVENLIFETHAHYDDHMFDEDRDELIGSLQAAGIGRVVNIGSNLANSQRTVDLVKKYDFFLGAVGVHPSDVDELDDNNFSQIEEMLGNDGIVAVGEIGLDYHYDEPSEDIQKKWFVRQLDLARRLDYPVVIHSRDAAKDTLDIMTAEKAGDIGGVVHCYSYSREQARDYLNMGYFFGIGGVVTFKNGKKLKEVVEYVPLDMIVLETDSPYLSPVPFRGKRNSSLYLPYVVSEIAAIKGVSEDEVRRITWENAHRLYRI